MELSSLEIEIANYLEKNTSFHKRVSMSRLSEMYGIDKRDTRTIIENIILSETLIIGNKNGYWVARSKQEIVEANKMSKSRVKKGIERLVANGGDIDFIFAYVNSIKQKYGRPIPNQLEMEIEYVQ